MSYAARFSHTKDLIKIHMRGKFHQYSIFLFVKLTDSASMKWSLLGVFWALTPRNIVRP